MKLKSYFAESVEAAMDQASKELGPETMLVYSRQSSPEAKHLGAYEVVFGTGAMEPAEPPKTSAENTPTYETKPAAAPPDLHRLSTEIGELKRLVGRLSGAIARTSVSSIENGPLAAPLGLVADDLIAAGLSEDTTYELIDSIRHTPDFNSVESAPGAASVIRKMVRDELMCRVATDNRIGTSGGGAKVIAVVGPPGAGKTTALVKLAATHAMRAQKPAQILSADTYRVAAAEQLRSYAAILGMGFQLFDTVGAIANALVEHQHKELVLIDTPGYGPRDLDVGEELAAFLRVRSGIDVHLVLPASMKPSDMHSVSDRYERFRPTRLLFTKLDETVSGGSIVAECLRTKWPVSFLTSGQQIPEDIEEATREKLVDMIFPEPVFSPSLEQLRSCPTPNHWDEPVADRAAAA
jgi:flagellar biosynthesis protein FlhF